jgi:hypothetical protein
MVRQRWLWSGWLRLLYAELSLGSGRSVGRSRRAPRRSASIAVLAVEVEVGAADFDDGKRIAEARVLGAEASRHDLCASGLATQCPKFVVAGGVIDADGVAALRAEYEA